MEKIYIIVLLVLIVFLLFVALVVWRLMHSFKHAKMLKDHLQLYQDSGDEVYKCVLYVPLKISKKIEECAEKYERHKQN